VTPRVEADDEVVVTAYVRDAETPLDQLAYGWTAAPANGTFIGTGPQVRWRAPHLQPTPDLYTLTLSITEKYTQNGGGGENKVSRTAQVHYNDSYRKIYKLTSDFLTDFGNFSVRPQQTVRNFSDSCQGKVAELHDVQDNRANYHILAATFTIARIDLN